MNNIHSTVTVFDTTLRDGDQAGGWFNEAQSLSIARMLERANVDVIEAGFAKPRETARIQKISRAVRRPIICALALCKEENIREAAKALDGADRGRIHLYKASSPDHLGMVFRQEPAEYLDDIARHIDYARRYFDDIEFSAENATNTDRQFLVDIGKTAYEAGARTFNVPDTYGKAVPSEIQQTFAYLADHLPGIQDGSLTLSTHNHDDYGLATINSLAALQGMGHAKKQVEVTINGMGERAGNADMVQVVMTSRLRNDMYQTLNMDHIHAQHFVPLSQMVSEYSGIPVPRNAPYTGEGVRRTGTGTHMSAQQKIGAGYQQDIALMVGHDCILIELTASSGRNTVQAFAKVAGLPIPTEHLSAFTESILDFAEMKRGTGKAQISPQEFRILYGRFFGFSQ